MATDIRHAGLQSWRDLQKQNEKPFNPETASAEDWYKQLKKTDYNAYSNQPTEYVGVEAANVGYGTSQYDEGLVSASQLNDLGDIRYQNQPWYDTLANGIGKMLGTAGTTFLSSLVGLPYGLFEAANQGRWSALWDNDVTQGLSNVDKWLEENMTNYRSQVQQNSPWYNPENLFSMNFIADDVIKNMGFTLGAAASMAVGSGSLGLMSRALGFVNEVGKGTKMGQAALSALFSATGEGMIEAKQGVEERNKLEMQRLDDAFEPERAALKEEFDLINQEYAATKNQSLVMGLDGKAYDPAYERYMQRVSDLQAKQNNLQQRYDAGRQQIIESGQDMGNTILLANQGLLTMGNLIQFGKGMVKGFDKARHAAETSSKAVKPFGVRATKAGANLLESGYKISGKNFGKAIAAGKGLLTEGSEEMNQQWIQSSSGAAYNEQNINDYWKAKLDPDSYRETTKGLYTMGQILDRGFNESWGDLDQWEQFVIGGLTGMTGSYSPTKIFNQDKTKSVWNPARYGSWEGGAYKGIRDFNRDYRQYEENISDLNKILQSEDFPARVRSMVGHAYTEEQMNDAALDDDKKAYKDAEDKQFVHDIQTFLRAGKLDDLRAIYNEIGSEVTDEDVESIVKSTTKEITAEEDKQNFDRQMDEQIASHQRTITDLQNKARSIGESQEMLGINERADYQAAVIPALEDIFRQIDAEYNTIDNLQQQKQAYVGQKYYEGAYVDRQGNRTATNDEIRQTVKHNSEELNRKLDSYLDSINKVNEDTGGNLTKDQEDNLAYLHHLGKESLVRADKIISDKRKQLPTKFLMKTDKTPEQLSKEYVSSDLVFDKNEDTKEGYVEVDTSLMDDRSFRNFFIGELLWGGNIDPEFAETADERAAREEEEKNLPEAERKQRAKERLTRKWKDALEKRKKDAEEQRDANGDLIAQYFVNNYRKNNNANQAETQQALNDFFQDIVDAASLVSQAGEYDRTLRKYMANPLKVDEDKAKEEAKANQVEAEQQAKNKFAGKDARQMKQEVADGTLSIDEFEEFAGADLSNVTDDDVKAAQVEAKKAQEGMQRASALKNHIQEQLGDNPTEEELNAAQIAMQMVDNAGLAAENPSDINVDMPELSQVPLDAVDPNASIDDIEDLNSQVQEILSGAFNSLNEDENAQGDIPEVVPSDALNDVEAPTTGHDETTKTAPEVVAPAVSSPSKAAPDVAPKNPLTEGAIDNIIKETSSAVNSTNTTGTWRSTTTRNPYGKSTGTYHEAMADKNSLPYKRSKAIWEFLNEEGAFDRMENADNDRIKAGDTIHFFVGYLPEIFDGKDFDEVPEDDRIYGMVIFMMDDNGEVLGDLPLAQLEPSFRSGNPTQQVKDLLAFQNKVFDAFTKQQDTLTNYVAVVDNMQVEGMDNLNLTFDNAKKSPLVSKVKQVMRGAVPYRKSEKNTLNEVVQGTPELAVKVTGTNVATKRGDRNVHRDIVIPSIGNVGQPYLLLPTASGEKIAVPFYMPAFNAEQHRNTELYKQLSNALFYMLPTNGNSKQNIENFGKHMDVVEGLLQVKRQEGAKRVLEIDTKNNIVTLHLQSLTDPNQKYDLSVPYSDSYKDLAKALADSLSGIPINVSLQYLNDNIQTGMGSGMVRRVSYNQVIGEIADINLPKATKHTVNSWFTVELTTKTGTKPSKAVTPKNNGVREETPKPTKNRRDYVKEIAEASTIQDLIAIQKAFTQAQADGEISAEDMIKLTGYVNQKRASNTLEAPDVSGVAASSAGAVSFEEATPQPVKPKAKTIEQIEAEAKQKRIVTRQTKDAWEAIPDALKLKMANEGATLQLAYFTQRGEVVFKNSVVNISMLDRENLIKALTAANMAAKAGNLKVSEAVKPMEKTKAVSNKENEQAARRWLAKNLPSLSSEERTQFVDKLARMGDNAGKYWGSYRSGVIQIQNNAPMGTVYHEAFHYVMDMLLDPEERQMLLDIAKNEYGVGDNWTAEERLAEDFRRYSLDENAEGIVGRIKRWLRKIKDKMLRYNRISDATINQLFWKINNGELAEKSELIENFEKTQQIVLREIRNVQNEKMSWNNLDASTKAALKDSGLSKAAYDEMSLEEKEQYVKCRG